MADLLELSQHPVRPGLDSQRRRAGRPTTGWSAYYRHCVSSKVFDELDDHMWKLTYKWANWTHPHKGKRWIVRKYFGRFARTRRRPVGVR